MSHLLSFILTVLLHIIIFIFINPSLNTPSMDLTSTPIAPLHVSLMSGSDTIKIDAIVKSDKMHSVKKIKPKRLPGDRSKAVVENKIPPLYPKNALNQNLEGKIVVKVKINPKGNISSLKIIQSTGHTLLDNAFIHTLKYYYSFKPKRVMGKNVSSYITLSYEFKI